MMKIRNIVAIALLTITTAAVAQSIEGYYVEKSEPDGKIYFLNPQELFEDENGKKLAHDITIKCTETENTATITITYVLPTAKKARMINIKSRKFGVTSQKPEQIYIEPAKKGWAHRYSMTTSKERIKEFYDQTNPPIFTIINEDGTILKYTKAHKNWMKYSPIGKRIFDVIDMN